ncbi:hypothetical protein BDW69DRAFT_189927 [Aspergillus filifer]
MGDLDPIAVVGFSLKFPQDADSAETFWEMLYSGRCAMTEIPEDRFAIDSFLGQQGEAGVPSGTIPLRGGHFLKQDLGVFDAKFFNITPAEAEAMDPQHRLMLETSYQALENAGITITQCAGSKTSVYTASFTDDYKSILMSTPDNIPKYAATGLSMSMLANRVSWFYGFTGPSMNLDSACSSSLSALHVACQDLQSGVSKMALVGGSNLVFHPDFMLIMSNMDFLSPNSRCYSFDHRANGYARGDGVSVLVLKKLSQAIKDGDTIRAVIRATGLNQDGRTPGGITQPSGDAQRMLIQETFERAQLDMQPVRFFEAHGTGTAIGDPTEARAIGDVFRKYRSLEEPLFVGAVKSNIGHLEGGSGIAGVIKTVLILERGVILPNAGLETINPQIDTEGLCIKFPTQPIMWPGYGLRRACVNSFGFGGSNAMIIIDDALHYLEQHGIQGLHRTVDIAPRACPAIRTAPISAPATPRLLVWSAVDQAAISKLKSAYAGFLKKKSPVMTDPSAFLDMVYTLARKRTLHSWRLYAVGRNSEDLGVSMVNSNPVQAAASAAPGSLAFIFTGQGAQYARMGYGLLALPFFQNRFEQLDRLLEDIGCEWSLLELLKNSDAPVNEPQYSQAYTTALQLAIIDYFYFIGIRPAAVVGHSSGEIAAAYCAGALSDSTALTIAFHRGRLAQRSRGTHSAPGQGMLAVAMSEQAVQSYLDRLEDGEVQIGCVNSPKSITLTGSKAHLEQIEEWLVADGVFARMLRANVAYHSRFLDTIGDDYLQALSGIPREPDGDKFRHRRLLPMVSAVTGTIISAKTLCDPAYWVRNMVSQVNFSAAVGLLSKLSNKPPRKQLGPVPQSLSGINILLEVGPHSTLQGPIQDILAHATDQLHERISYSHALHRQKHAGYSILETVGYLWSRGYPIDLLKANCLSQSPRAIRTDLPAYPFNHTQRHWFEDRLSTAFRFRRHAPHELLGALTPDSNVFESRWRNILHLDKLPWLEDHRITGNILLPAAAMLTMVIEAARQLQVSSDHGQTISSFEFRNVRFLNVLQVPTAQGLETSVVLSTTNSSYKDIYTKKTWYGFRIFSYGRECVEHSSGTIGVVVQLQKGENNANHQSEQTVTQAFETESFEKTDIKELYTAIHTNGVNYGPVFQVLHNLRLDDNGVAISEIRPCSDKAQIENKLLNYWNYPLHPSMMDGLFQLVFAALSGGGSGYPAAMVPSYLGKMVLFNKNEANCATCSGVGHESFLAYNKSAFLGYRGTESTVLAICSSSKRLACFMERYQTTFVSSPSASSSNGAFGQARELRLLSSVIWQPDLSLLTNQQLGRLCEVARAGHDDNDSDDANWHLNLLIQYYVRFALQHAPPAVGFSAVLPGGIAGMLQPILASLEEMNPHMPVEVRKKQSYIQESPRFRQALEDKLSAVNSVAKFYISLGQRLMRRLVSENERQNIAPQLQVEASVEAPVEGHGLFMELLQEQLNSSQILKPLKIFMDLLVHKSPLLKLMHIGWKGDSDPGRFARMLSGSTHGTWPWVRYDYVGLSEEGFVQADPAFTDRFGDINKTPHDLGRHQYDLVIATQLLYMTPNPEETLNRIREFLKPTTRGGYLVLHGISLTHHPRAGLAAILGSEWLSSHGNSPYCAESELNRMLVRSGFTGIDVLIPDTVDPRFRETSTVIARTMIEQIGHSLSANDQCIVIIIDGKSNTQQAFARRLVSAIARECDMEMQVCISSLSVAVTTGTLKGKFCLSLLDYHRPFFTTLTPSEFELLKQALFMAGGFLWVSGGVGNPQLPEFHLVDGLARSLRSENSMLRFVRLAIANCDSKSEAYVITVLREVITSPSLDEMELEYEELDGVLQIGRVVQSQHMNRVIRDQIAGCHHRATVTLGQDGISLQTRIPQPGEGSLLLTSDGFLLEEATKPTKGLEADEILVQVHTLGISHQDYLIASGHLNSTDFLSVCVGIVHDAGASSGFAVGEQVLVSYPAVGRTWLKCPASSATSLPQNVSFASAAALLAEMLPAIYALYYMVRLEIGDTVLVQCPSGDENGIAHAADLVAKYLGANMIQHQSLGTNSARGVDVVLYHDSSSTSLDIALDALAHCGTLIIASAGIAMCQHHQEMAAAKSITIATVDLAQVHHQRPARIQKLLRLFVSIYLQAQECNGATTESTQKNRVRVYKASELSTALESMKKGHCFGPSAVDFTPGQSVSVKSFPALTLFSPAEMRESKLIVTEIQALVAPRPFSEFDPHATYVVAGGFGGLGRSICRWMVSQGARHLLILSRSGNRNESARELIEELSSLDARVYAPECDISQTDSLRKVLAECDAVGLPRIRGCIQCTMVLRDAVFTNMTHDQFTASIRPKVLGSWNLHDLLPTGMDFFVLLSSVGGILGAPSQANYCAGNTYMDALARYRTSLGETAVSIDLGMMVSAGVVAETDGMLESLQRMGYFMEVTEKDLFALLDYYCRRGLPGSLDADPDSLSKAQIVVGIETPAGMGLKGLEPPHWMQRPFFSHFQLLDQSSPDSHHARSNAGTGEDIGTILQQSSSAKIAAQHISYWFIAKLSQITGIPSETIDPAKPVHAANGINSLVAVELRNWFEKKIGADVAVFEILGAMSIAELSDFAAGRTKFR